MKYKILLNNVNSCAVGALMYVVLLAPCLLLGQANETVVDGIEI